MTPDATNLPDAIPTPDEGILLTFPKGLVGFPSLTQFRLFEPQDAYPLKFLQSVEEKEVAFVCIDPVGIKADYEVPLDQDEAEALHLELPEEALVLTLVVVPEDPRHMTTNLAGPLVINIKTLKGFQLVLSSDKYPLRFPILPLD
jgi:flagellar assembly factor FliW